MYLWKKICILFLIFVKITEAWSQLFVEYHFWSNNDLPNLIRIHNDNSNPGFGGPAENFEKLSKNLCTNHSFVHLLVRSKIFQILVRADAIDLVQKSSNFEPSLRFFGRLKILNSKRRRNEAFEFDSSCRDPKGPCSSNRIQMLQSSTSKRWSSFDCFRLFRTVCRSFSNVLHLFRIVSER